MEQQLRNKIEEMVNRRMSLPRDFTWLSEEVERRTRQRLSASTLRRFWGYVDEGGGVKASRFTKMYLHNLPDIAITNISPTHKEPKIQKAKWL